MAAGRAPSASSAWPAPPSPISPSPAAWRPGDSLVQQILGTGIAARLSARLGEGVVNGLLTARVGIAAIEVCRPLPFINGSPPRLADVMAALRPLAARRQEA